MNSVKWRFILIYFLLVLAVLLIVATSITGRLEKTLINDRITATENQIRSLISSSSYFQAEILDENTRGIKASLTERRFQSGDDVYVLSSEDFETVLASKTDNIINYEGQYAYNVEELNVYLIKEAYKGKVNYQIDVAGQDKRAHIAVPVMGNLNHVKGIVYAILNLDSIAVTLQSAKKIIFDSGLVALFITIILSYFISSSITNPIRKVTEVAEKMSEGDFDQRVDVNSDDEIGDLSKMFNLMAVELKNNIQKTELERAKLDTIFNQMLESVVAINRDFEVIHMNDSAKELLGINQEEEIPTIVLEPEFLGIKGVNFANPYTLEGEAELQRNGKSFRVLYAPFEDKDLNVGGLIIIYQDMTKERKLEEVRREFVANVSHELKTPITSIKSYTETLLKYPVDLETSKKFLQVIDSESDRMAHIVRDLLTLTTLDYKTEEKVFTSCNLSELAHSAVERLKLMIKDKHMAVYEEYDYGCESMVDQEDLIQVIINLVSNAVKYTPEGGIIKVKTYEEGGYNFVRVEDNGIGIPEKDQAHIFERFYRVEKSRSRALGGTGLGLAIAKEMIESMNGTISVSSDGRNGSVFTLRFKAVDKDGEI